jgi:hypothetical protein
VRGYQGEEAVEAGRSEVNVWELSVAALWRIVVQRLAEARPVPCSAGHPRDE